MNGNYGSSAFVECACESATASGGLTDEPVAEITNPTLNAEPINTNRTAHVNLIDIRIDRAITIRGTRLLPFFDLYNITNSNAEQNISVSSGASWLRPITIIAPRLMRVGVKFDW